MANDLTDAIYWASKPPEVVALHTLPFEQREAAAQKLDSEGFTIDREIDIWGWEPILVMQVRTIYGIKQASAAAFSDSGTPKFIRTSLDSADYPPITAAPPPPLPVKPVGPLTENGIYAANVTACIRPDGSSIYQNGVAYPNVNGDGKSYVYHAGKLFGGWQLSWTLA